MLKYTSFHKVGLILMSVNKSHLLSQIILFLFFFGGGGGNLNYCYYCYYHFLINYILSLYMQ